MPVSDSSVGTNELFIILKKIRFDFMLWDITIINRLQVQDHLGTLCFQNCLRFFIMILLYLVFWMLISKNSGRPRSEEHASELQSHVNLVCRLLIEKKEKN